MVPEVLLMLLEGIRLPNNGEPHEWAQWVMQLAYMVPPVDLVRVIEEQMNLSKPLVEIIASSALAALAQHF